ncbi:hypothetical protein ACFL2R_04200 [Patescibacteria group bacterium]
MKNKTVVALVGFLVVVIIAASWFNFLDTRRQINPEVQAAVDLSQLKEEFQGNERVLEAIRDLINLRNCKYDIVLVSYAVEDVAGVVADGLISWEALGTNEVELDFFVEHSRIKRAKQGLENLRKCEYGAILAFYVMREIRYTVYEGLISWEALGTNEAELGCLFKQARIKETKADLKKLRNCTYDEELIPYVVDDIIDTVSDDLISWEALGVRGGERELRSIAESTVLCGAGEWDLF